MIQVTTIGFSKKTLRKFVDLLKSAQVTCLVDTRLNNTSQLSGFAKRDDLQFILEELVGIKYIHCLDLAPTQDILSGFKEKRITWEEYTERYLTLLRERNIEHKIDELIGENQVICFLCSEHKPHNCHRSLLTQYIQGYREDIEVVHLY
ncbi:DUF488 domain-containing protein [Bacillus sp. K6W]|uniref:DUF488 domain-containing protein n=1 Tax=Bacillus sp. K6W TaxID=2249215 RepID=UPI000DF73339|nr:DUF488 domain-containing protein [Bacillus sp. K6W]